MPGKPDAQGARRKPRRGLSLDRLVPAARPPLPHTVTLEAPPRPRRGDRPPLRRSIRLEDDAAVAEERRRVFGHGPHQLSFDEGDVTDEEELEHECECQRASLDRSGGTSAETPDDVDELEFAISPPAEPTPPPMPPRPHLRGVSSDRVLSDRRDGSPAIRAPARAFSQGIFERRLPKIYKFGLMDKSKRASSSALYERNDDRSPTEQFYNATGSTRLSSQELFEKFCSEEFTSLYGRGDDRRRRAPHSKSTGSSGSDVRHERACCRRAPCGSQPALGQRHVLRARSDRSTDSEEQSSPGRRIPHNYSRSQPYDYDDEEEEGQDDYSRSAPLLSPDRFEARFTFDISEHSEVPSCRDETPSDATETRNLTLYEEPHSDRTSLCELYDAAFSSQRPSFRRNSYRRRHGNFDLSALDFRAIDDESPRISRRPSERSPDETLRHNSESRSWASDSVFNTPERRVRELSPTSVDTQKFISLQSDSQRADSAAADSTVADTTVVEEEPTSVIERTEYALALKLGRIDLEEGDDAVMLESVGEATVTSPGSNTTRMSSRPSMHKLEPIEPARLSSGAGRSEKADSPGSRRQRRGTSEPRHPGRCFPL